MSLPPREVFAKVTRQAVEDHREWDSPHAFITLHWDGEKLTYGTFACITPDIHPDRYPAMMIKMAGERSREFPADPAYAYLLQIESFGVTMPDPAESSAAEMRQFEADRLGRTFHERPDAVEACTAWCADIHGRLWEASKIRGGDEVVGERFHPPVPTRPVSGRFISGLLACAYATGMSAYGLPGPPTMAN